MEIKDYYKTLKIQPTASQQQVKASFRKLALQHHPDKNPDNVYAAALFREIQEAYEVLSDPGKREEYNYKRWYNRSISKDFTRAVLSPADIIAEANHLHGFLNSVNAMRINFDGLSQAIRDILTEQNLAILEQAHDQNANNVIIDRLLPAVQLLPFPYIDPLLDKLHRVAASDQVLNERLLDFREQQLKSYQWQRNRPWMVAAATVLLCGIIYFLSQ
jgi:curved DNA-binding protein CbpA